MPRPSRSSRKGAATWKRSPRACSSLRLSPATRSRTCWSGSGRRANRCWSRPRRAAPPCRRPASRVHGRRPAASSRSRRHNGQLTKAAVATIGFTKTSAQGFFDRLLKAGVRKVVDVRLHNTSQLAGFAKAEDLAYFLKKIARIEYAHEPLLAPTDAMLKAFKKER